MKHTKGKWNIKEVCENLNGLSSFVGYQVVSDNEVVIAKETTEANANLIAASPELLDCLQDAMTDLIEYMSPGQRHHFRKVIKRAKGEL